MENKELLDGQISIFELSNLEYIRPKDKVQDMQKIKTDTLDNVIYFKVGDKVQIEYMGIKVTGKVVRIYNNNETVNVVWDDKETAFYFKNVIKIKE